MQREVKNEKGGGSDKDPTYSLCGRGVPQLPWAQRAWAQTFEQRSPERKSSPSCRLLTVAAARCPETPSASPPPALAEPRGRPRPAAARLEQLIHHGSLTGSRSGRLLCYTAESQRENLRGLCLQSSLKRGFWVSVDTGGRGDVP